MEVDVAVLGINHKTAPVEVREKLSFSEKELEDALNFSQQARGLQETVIISTCNRTEVYGVVDYPSDPRSAIIKFLTEYKDIGEDKLKDCFYIYRGKEAVLHLFKVASGLDSMVLGETQILGQVKEAYYKSMEVDRVDTIFHALFQQAITVGKRIQRETEINDHAASVSYVAVNLVKRIFDTLSRQKVMIVGAGEMAQLTLKHLCEEGVKDLIIVNRNREQARNLARTFSGRVVGYEYMIDWMKEADIVVSSTSAPHFIINEEKMKKVMEEREGRKMFLIDIAVPRDVDPEVKKIQGVYLYNIDDLQAVLDSNMKERELAAKKARKIIDEEACEFQCWLKARMVVPMIKALKERAEGIRTEHLERAMEKLKGLSDKEKKVVENLSKSIVNSFLRDPVLRLKEIAGEEEAEESISQLCDLFDLELEGEYYNKSKKMNRR
ncbi:MAG: glutamyl-tRNA reductase [Candidatus Syntrophonatronum acetioxidans]|uniref:Glutamyl-tRNA reductase n=1 Tax=Candidatus Syntrophonatronum acetioxidans TaxID=1795816 RepID=A0A424Y8V2_9FIRM|nr:MAG: glutamyl-tRNA reductase [Candidatus Syntrophonatronum acetioxidans]